MEAMAPDEMDQDRRQKSGREELEDTVQDQIRAKEHEISKLREEIKEKEEEIKENEAEIRGVEKEIAIASGTEVRKPLEAKLQFLRQQIISLRQEISSVRSVQEAPAWAGKSDASWMQMKDALGVTGTEEDPVRAHGNPGPGNDHLTTRQQWLKQELPGLNLAFSTQPGLRNEEIEYYPESVKMWESF